MSGARAAFGAITATLVAWPLAAAAQDGRFSADVSATAGYSNNPFSILGNDTGSALVGLDILPRYQIQSARDTFSVSGSASLQQYVRRYSRNDSYSAAVDYLTRPSERVTAHTRLDLSSSVLGASNSFLPAAGGVLPGVTTGTGATSPGSNVLPVTSVGASSPLTDVGLFGLRNRRRLGRGSADASIGLSALDSVTVSGYAEAARYRSSLRFGNYQAYSGSVGYSRRVSEQFTVGIRGTASVFDYRTAGSDSRVFPVEVTATGQLNSLWSVDGALGATIVDSDAVGSTRRTSVSGNINFCRRGELSTMCVQASRQVAPTGLVGSQYVTTAGLNWSKRLRERESLSLNASYSNVGGGDSRFLTAGIPLQTQFVQAVGGYDRQLGERLRLVASATYRQLLDGGGGRPKDFGGQLGLSYRIGDAR